MQRILWRNQISSQTWHTSRTFHWFDATLSASWHSSSHGFLLELSLWFPLWVPREMLATNCFTIQCKFIHLWSSWILYLKFQFHRWFGLSKCCFHNFVYCFANKNFANAYMKLLSYCCCKTTVSTVRRRQNDVTPRSDVRVHIIPGYGNLNTYTSPQRSHCNEIWSII